MLFNSPAREKPFGPLCHGLLAVCFVALSACDSDDSTTADTETQTASEVPGATSASAIGEVLSFGAASRTLYTFANDTDGTSNCNDGCAAAWPPINAGNEQQAGQFSTIERNDGSLQWAFKGSPLYYYEGDAAEGEVNGEGLSGVWYVARPDPVTSGETGIGTVLVSSGSTSDGSGDAAQRQQFNGRTLYVFASDTAGVSNCDGGCAANWPPLYADKGAKADGSYTVIERSDGSSQWAYQSQPLYFYTGDSAAGDTTGDGVGGVWSAARP